MASKATATSPLRLLLNAEPFGFGPSAAIADCFPYLRKIFAKIGYVGSGHTLDLQRRLDYDAVHEVAGDDALQPVFAQYDLMLTALDFGMAERAQKAGLPVCIYDPLTWYWRSIPPVVKSCALYIAQDFYGVKERLNKEAQRFGATRVVQPLLPSTLPWRGEREHVLLNLGGLSNPLWGDAETKAYARLIVSAFCRAVGDSEKVVIAANSMLVKELAEFGAVNFTREQMQDVLHKAKYALMTPGLGNIYDAARFATPTVWLPPANDSQGQQRVLLEKHKRLDGFLDWSQFVPGCTIDYRDDQTNVLSQIARAVATANGDLDCRRTLETLMGEQAQHVSRKTVGNTTSLLFEFGWDGASQVAELVLQEARKLEPRSRKLWRGYSYNLALAGSLRVRLRHPHKIFAEQPNRLLAGAYVPGFSLEKNLEGAPDLTVSFQESTRKRLEVDGRRRQIELFDQWRGDGSTLDLLHLIQSAARLEWLKRGLYSVHSSCVGNEHGYALIVGHSGVGKTTIALQLTQSGMKLYSGNKTLVSISSDGRITAVGGTKTITTRAQDAGLHSQAQDGVDYGQRCAFLLDDSQYASASRVPITMIVLAKLNPGADDFRRLQPTDALHRLYPYFMDTVNADTVLCDGDEVFSGSAPQGCQRRLSTTLSAATGKVPVCSMTGSMHYITQALEHELCPKEK